MKFREGFLRNCSELRQQNHLMADIYTLLAFIGFTLLALGYIWALERV